MLGRIILAFLQKVAAVGVEREQINFKCVPAARERVFLFLFFSLKSEGGMMWQKQLRLHGPIQQEPSGRATFTLGHWSHRMNQIVEDTRARNKMLTVPLEIELGDLVSAGPP